MQVLELGDFVHLAGEGSRKRENDHGNQRYSDGQSKNAARKPGHDMSSTRAGIIDETMR